MILMIFWMWGFYWPCLVSLGFIQSIGVAISSEMRHIVVWVVQHSVNHYNYECITVY